MNIINCEQRSPEWFAARLGIPTSSEFRNIFTSQSKPASGQTTYMNTLLAEWLTGKPVDKFTSEWMERGTELEDEARDFYILQSDNEVQEVGLIKSQNGLSSCSPDGLIGDDGGVEIKCPKANTQISYLLGNKIPAAYVPQVQGSMMITGRKWWDFVSYHPDMPTLIVRVKRDDEYIYLFQEEIEKFLTKMLAKREKLIDMGYKPEQREAA